MKTVRMRMAGLLAAPLALFAALELTPAAAESMPGPRIALRVGQSVGRTLVPEEPAIGPRRAATINVTYVAPFPRAAKRAFQRAVNIWAARLNSTVPITVHAEYRDLGNPNILGSAGPSFIHRNFPNAPLPNVFYVDALANKLRGQQLNAAFDCNCDFNSTFPNWHFGRTAAPANTFDFTSVVLHELGHCIGIIGGGFVSGGQGFIRAGSPPNHLIWSQFVKNGANTSILTFAEGSAALGTQLQSNNLFINTRRVRRANGGNKAKIFAPNPFQGGSSYSHLDENTFPPGNPHSLMTPFLGQGETIRNPGGVTQAILKDSGW